MFWPESIPAESPDLKKRFSFRIKIDDPDYSDYSYRFDIEITSESRVISSLHINRSYNLKDLYVFKNDFTEEGLEP